MAMLAASSLPALAQDKAPQVQTGPVDDGAITVDGRLDEAAWAQAGVIEDLTQQSPHPGEPTPYHTKVMLLRSHHTLYIGIRCEDPDIATSAVHTMVRDGWQGNDDNVLFMLDTFGTKRFAYVFRVNSAGAMADGLQSPTPAINSNDGVDYNWDGIWSAVVTRDDHGWTAELAIDTRSLQFTNGLTRWGLNISRNVPRVLLTLDWAGTTLDSSVYQLQREGTLTGVQDMEQGNGLDFQPYGLMKYKTSDGYTRNGTKTTITNTTSNTGFDLKYNFNPSLAGLLTYHTDFAEAEADQQQINTTRFPLFFPEKRQFFLQGSNLFSFGYNLGTTLIPFNSRTVGLLNGQEVPLDEGAKLIGQSDAGSLALLDTQMAGHDVVLIPGDRMANPPVPDVRNDPTNLFVGRGTYNLDPELQLGTIVTHGDPTGLDTNTFVGTDATWKSSTFQGDKNLNLAAWAGHSSGTASNGFSATGNTNAYGLDVEYPNDLWYAHTQYGQFGAAFDPALGFVPRPGSRHYMNELGFQPRPAADSWWSWVHRFWFYGHYSEDDSFGPAVFLPPDPNSPPPSQPQLLAKQGKQSSEWFLSPQMLTQGGWYWEFDVYRDYDAPTSPFSVVNNDGTAVNIPAGEYTYTRRRIVFNSPQSESLWWQVVASQGTFYAGTATHPSVTLNWNTPSGRLVLSATQEWLFYYQPQYLNPGKPDHGVARLSTLTGTYSFTPDIYLSTQMQYDQDVENAVSYNVRLRWIVEGASNIYLVLNHGLVTETTGTNGSAVPAPGNEVILKVQWDFRN
jgi:uncharacterized protein DUF5916